MSRRPAKHTQAELARALRAAEQATGEKHVIVFDDENGKVLILPRQESPLSTERPHSKKREIVF